jgi:8-oxo-dGTP diphosphatase
LSPAARKKRRDQPDPPGQGLERLVLSVDVVVLCVSPDGLKVLFQRREAPPFEGKPGLPGVAVLVDETLESAARRALREKAGLPLERVGELHVEQLATFGALFRDPRGRTVSVAYLALSKEEDELDGGAHWVAVSSIGHGSLPFDHEEILQTAVERLRGKVRYTDIASNLVHQPFPIDRLHGCYEAVLGRALDRSNFRSKLLKIGMIEKVGVDTSGVGRRGGRPPHLYRFTDAHKQPRDFL